jgi:hypothetical protein
MISQIRIHTINKGEMDNFLKHFKNDIIPLHEKIGVAIVGTWVNRPQNEFIWVRNYKDKADVEAKTKEFQAAVAAAGVKLGTHVAKMEMREAESAFA